MVKIFNLFFHVILFYCLGNISIMNSHHMSTSSNVPLARYSMFLWNETVQISLNDGRKRALRDGVDGKRHVMKLII